MEFAALGIAVVMAVIEAVRAEPALRTLAACSGLLLLGGGLVAHAALTSSGMAMYSPVASSRS